MNIRERLEELEKSTLSPYAALSANTKGRLYPSEKCEVRTEFQRDRDRILHSKAFRRLKHKTQVFISPEGDHYRTRLTHTLEVSQIARTIARSLQLNEDLTEAMALGHDLGHTPFGHAGESALDEVCPFGFKHYEQSLRVVDKLEEGKGLNLTFEVRDGIENHTGKKRAKTLEGAVLKLADRIAYINHDIDDALRGGVIKESELPKDCVHILGKTHGERIDTMIKNVIESSIDKPFVKADGEIADAMAKMREFMFERVYIGSAAKLEENRAKYVVKKLFAYFAENTEEMPPSFFEGEKQEPWRLAADYIAGMTDRYAMYKYERLFLPKAWYKH